MTVEELFLQVTAAFPCFSLDKAAFTRVCEGSKFEEPKEEEEEEPEKAPELAQQERKGEVMVKM